MDKNKTKDWIQFFLIAFLLLLLIFSHLRTHYENQELKKWFLNYTENTTKEEFDLCKVYFKFYESGFKVE